MIIQRITKSEIRNVISGLLDLGASTANIREVLEEMDKGKQDMESKSCKIASCSKCRIGYCSERRG